MPLGVNEFPQHLQADYLWVMKELTKYPSEHPNIYGPVEATMRRIKNSTGKKIAARIFAMYAEIQNIRGFPLLDYRHPSD